MLITQTPSSPFKLEWLLLDLICQLYNLVSCALVIEMSKQMATRIYCGIYFSKQRIAKIKQSIHTRQQSSDKTHIIKIDILS